MIFSEAQLFTSILNTPRISDEFFFEYLCDKGYFELSLSLHSLPCLKLTTSYLLWTEWTINKFISCKSRPWGKENAQWEVHELYYILHGLRYFIWLIGGILLLASFLYSRLLRLLYSRLKTRLVKCDCIRFATKTTEIIC